MNGAKKQPDNHSDEGEDGGEYVVEDGLLDRHPGLEQHRKVPDLVRQLVAEDGQGRREAAHVAVGEGGADGESVRQVVDAVTEDDHPGHAGDVLWRRVGVAVGVTVTMMKHLVLRDDHRVPAQTVLHRPVLDDGAAGVTTLHHQVLLGVQVAGTVAAVLVLAHLLPDRLV